MLEAKNKAVAVLEEARCADKFDDQLLHAVSDIVEELGKLTVPVRSTMLIGEEVSQSIYNCELVRPYSITAITAACTKLSELSLSRMERFEISDQLQVILHREARYLDELREGTQNVAESRSLIEAQDTLNTLGRAISMNNFKAEDRNTIRAPYELGGDWIHINALTQSLPRDLQIVVETLLDEDLSNRSEIIASSDFQALLDTISEYRLDIEDRQRVLKCIALVCKDSTISDLAIKEYFKNLESEEHRVLVDRMLTEGKTGISSASMYHYERYMSETFTNQLGAWPGNPETLLTLTRLADLLANGSKFENIGASVYSALYAVKGTIGITDEVTQVAKQLSSLVAQEYREAPSTYRKFLLDFKLAEPSPGESFLSALGRWWNAAA